eukprot:4138049-Prymnesium_polylepis.1
MPPTGALDPIESRQKADGPTRLRPQADASAAGGHDPRVDEREHRGLMRQLDEAIARAMDVDGAAEIAAMRAL